jgi:uncharacterized protein YgbK (DUF1537 family)
MRITLDIADDVLLAAKEAAQRHKQSVGQVISELARTALQSPSVPASANLTKLHGMLAALGVSPLLKRGGMVSNAVIDRLRGDGIH